MVQLLCGARAVHGACASTDSLMLVQPEQSTSRLTVCAVLLLGMVSQAAGPSGCTWMAALT